MGKTRLVQGFVWACQTLRLKGFLGGRQAAQSFRKKSTFHYNRLLEREWLKIKINFKIDPSVFLFKSHR